MPIDKFADATHITDVFWSRKRQRLQVKIVARDGDRCRVEVVFPGAELDGYRFWTSAAELSIRAPQRRVA